MANQSGLGDHNASDWFRTKENRESKHDVDESENVTSRFCNHFSIIQTHYAWKMCSNYPGIKLEPVLGT